MGRRWGKTVLGGCLSLATAASGGHVAWIVPTYRNGRALWRWCEQATAHLVSAGYVSMNRAERMIEFRGGGFLGVYSADNEDSIRSEAFHLVVLDEAARMRETAWTDAIQPTLADYAGDAILISTPRGRNWFWREWIAADGHYSAAYRAPTSDNPNPRIQAAATAAASRVPDRTYRQEWLAEFVEDGGGIFRNVMQCATSVPAGSAQPGRQYVIGVDWGRTNDATVFKVVDIAKRSEIYSDRMTQTDYPLQRRRLTALWEKFGQCPVVAEANSMGGPLIEDLQNSGVPVLPFTTTNATKMQIIDALALAFEQANITILDDPMTIAELQAYEARSLPSGLWRYSAPEGSHDDCVMALALAWHGVTLAPSGPMVI